MKLNFILFAAAAAFSSAAALIPPAATVSSSAATGASKVTRDDLDELYKNLSTFANPKPVDQDAWLRECAYFIMKTDYPDAEEASEAHVNNLWVPADYFYKMAEHGHCTMKLESAFGMNWNYTMKQVFEDYFKNIEPETEEWAKLDMSGIVDTIPEMTLPSFMVEPQTAKDAIEVVKFAKQHSLQVSVKNTGHDYAGQSDVSGSFQLNMRNFPKYSAMDKYVRLCDKSRDYIPLEDPPCKLALARGKPAVVRVSGSEGNDSIYSSVHNWNHKQPREKRVQVSGGGEGSIGAGGGYLMGGGLGMGANDRKWGIMIDQVLELEMVLASGQHVKFGPSEWEVVEGYLYPQTRKVKGLCNKNVHHLEEKWEWGECEENIPFEDLWFAVRGGGGGTWGVLLSSWVQLHDDEVWYSLNPNEDALQPLRKIKGFDQSANLMWRDFYAKFFAGPISEEFGNDENDSCGSNDQVVGGYAKGSTDGTNFDAHGFEVLCIGKTPAEKFIRAWQNYVPTSKYLDENIDVELLKDFAYMADTGGNWGDLLLRTPLIGEINGQIGALDFNKTFALSDAADSSQNPNVFMKTPAGLAASFKSAGVYAPYGYNILIPNKMVAEYGELVQDLLDVCLHHTMGANAAISSDGMDSMPGMFRDAYFGCNIGLESVKNSKHLNVTTYEELDNFYSKIQSKVMEYVDEEDKANNIFPGFQEKNHVQGNTPLPLKDDWTKVCPYNLSTEERKEKCMSVQESIWGTKNLERLESIKKTIDPDNMFQVYIGVGQRDVTPQQEYKWPTQLPENYQPIQPNAVSVDNSYNSAKDGSSTSSSADGNRRLRGRRN